VSRVKARRDFLAANAGVRVPMPAFILLVKTTDLGETRAGFTVSKKIGNAVARNRARRRLKEAARAAMPGAAVPSADHIFIARRMDAERPFAALVQDTRHALGKAARKLAAGA
jgi:ribonuclease P protein component